MPQVDGVSTGLESLGMSASYRNLTSIFGNGLGRYLNVKGCRIIYIECVFICILISMHVPLFC